MNYNEIIYPKPEPTYGILWQGDHLDQQIYSLTAPVFIVTVDSDEQGKSANSIDHKTVFGDLSYVIPDTPDSCYPDNVLISMAESVIAILKSEGNCYLHCWAGVSRSSYLSCAVLMRMLGLTFNDALALLRASHPQANPNSGFTTHLQKLEKILMNKP